MKNSHSEDSAPQGTLFSLKEEKLTSSQVEYPVSQHRQQAKEKEQATIAGSGQTLLESFEKSNQLSPCLRTCVASLLLSKAWFSTKCVLTWKQMNTKSNRFVFQLAPSKLPIKERGSGLLPTPRVSETEGAPVKNAELRNGSWSRENRKGVRFGVKVKDVLASPMLPTPRAGNPGSRPNKKGGKILAEEVKKVMLPTPNARDTRGKSIKRDRMPDIIHGYDRGVDTGLKLQPSFVAWMMGFPLNWTELPFQSGEKNPSKPSAMP